MKVMKDHVGKLKRFRIFLEVLRSQTVGKAGIGSDTSAGSSDLFLTECVPPQKCRCQQRTRFPPSHKSDRHPRKSCMLTSVFR